MNQVTCAYTEGKTKLNLSPLGSGGEGAVYEIVGYRDRVAKIYHDLSDKQEMSKRQAKIEAMVAISKSTAFKNANLFGDIAWPLAPLYDSDTVDRKFIGFGMNRIKATTELDDLYVYPPKNNSTVTNLDRIQVLISLCDVIDRLHQTGQIFGDFNPNNIKIKPDWSVSFVDADSYHVRNAGKEYRCVVCAPGYVAPELIHACKGTTYADCPVATFTMETDRFALAIHVFRMLMNGCHPFICERHLQRTGSAPAPKPIDRRVESGETPFFKSVPGCSAPQYAPDISSLPPYLYNLFRKAFVDGHSDPTVRPHASEWKNALIRYHRELISCNHSHYYWIGNGSCPYCAADHRYSQKMGLVSIKSSTSTNRGGITRSTSAYQRRPATAIVSPSVAKHPNTVQFWLITLAIVVIMQVFMGLYVLPDIYADIFDEEILSIIGIIGSLVSGIVGAVLYNWKWAPGRNTGSHTLMEYVVSVLIAFGFTIGFGLAVGLLLLALYILFYILIGGLIIAFIAGFFGGS